MLFIGSAWGATSIDVTVDYGTIMGNNKFSVGFMMDYEWSTFSASSAQRQLAKDGNFKLVRLFSVRIEPCTSWYESSRTGAFNWASVDLLVQRIFETGAEPLICFGKFGTAGGPLEVPRGMAKNPATRLPYPDSYAAYCTEWVKHFKAVGLPVRYYEIVNEPYFYFGWDTYETILIGNFVKFFNTVARSMRSVNSAVLLSNDAFLQKKFLNYFVNYGDNLDFIDFHKYGLGEEGGTDAYAFSQAKTQRFIETSSWYSVDQARQIWNNQRGKVLPVIITESNLSYAWVDGSDSRIQQMAGAVYIALVLREAVLRGLSCHLYYVFSSSPSSQRSSKGFGMVNSDNNQPWYPYYVQKWLGTSLSVGDQLATITSYSSTISGLAWTHGQKLYFLLICEVSQAMTVYFHGLKGMLNFSRIDNTISWQTPKVQTGAIDSSQPLNINGYTVALFQAQASAPPPSSSPFEDSFESRNFGKWTGTSTTTGETATVVTTKPYQGSYSARFTSNGGANEEFAYCYRSVNMGEVYVRGYFNISSGLPLIDNGDRFYLLRLVGSQNLVYAGIRRDGGVDRWVVYVRNGANWMGWTSAATPLPQKGKWVCVELHWKMSSTAGIVELYIDGAKIITVTGINTTSYGNATRVDFGLVYANGVQNSLTIYADSAAINNTYISP